MPSSEASQSDDNQSTSSKSAIALTLFLSLFGHSLFSLFRRWSPIECFHNGSDSFYAVCTGSENVTSYCCTTPSCGNCFIDTYTTTCQDVIDTHCHFSGWTTWTCPYQAATSTTTSSSPGSSNKGAIAAAVIVPLLVIIGVVVAVALVFYRQRKRALSQSQRWEINYEELDIMEPPIAKGLVLILDGSVYDFEFGSHMSALFR